MNVTPKFNINYVKNKKIDLDSLEKSYKPSNDDLENDYNPFRLSKIQNYNPIYQAFFELNDKNYDSISLNHKYHFSEMSRVFDYEEKGYLKKPVFIKYSPLIDPFRYMSGKYDVTAESIRVLPKPKEFISDALPKLVEKNNASYIDNFFSYLNDKLMSQHNFINGVEYYGSFLTVQDKFKVNIADDLDYLNSSEYFLKNNKKLFTLSNIGKDEFMNYGSRSNKSKLIISNTRHNITAISINDTLDDIDCVSLDTPVDISNNNLIYENSKSASKSSDTTNNSETNYSDDEEDDEEQEEEDDEQEEESICEEEYSDECVSESDEENIYAYINDFPVQFICLEKCDGTLDELFMGDEMDVKKAASALMQIIMTLIIFQKAFQFTHNDLHTNNVMYVNTDIEFLYYKYNNQVYKVPTYGKIFKIIDFGRSIYKYKGNLFCSDSFAPSGDAHSQYNFEPFINMDKPRLEPNYSFDLCRLGCSIYDFIIDNDNNTSKFDELQKTIYRWCTDDNKKNILYKKNGEERYPNFKLYKMIARTVHQHGPAEQLEFPYFKQFLIQGKSKKCKNVMDIDNIPSYI
jgi:hypothetical protein